MPKSLAVSFNYVNWANKSDYLFLPILPFSLIPQAVLQMSPSKKGAHIQ